MYKAVIAWVGFWSVLVSFSGVPVFAEEVIDISVSDIHPTQPTAGFAATDAMRARKYKYVNDEAGLHAKLAEEKALGAVRGPGGEIYLTDGHHRALAAYRASWKVCQETKEPSELDHCLKAAKIHVTVTEDLSKSTPADFFDALVKKGNVYLPAQHRQKVARGELSKAMVFQSPGGLLPSSLGGLADDPMRSAVGELFYQQKPEISGDHFANYLEFLVAEKLAGKIEVESGHEFDPEVQKALAARIFADPETLKTLRCLAKRDANEWKVAQAEINQALGLASNSPFPVSECNSTSSQCVNRPSATLLKQFEGIHKALTLPGSP